MLSITRQKHLPSLIVSNILFSLTVCCHTSSAGSGNHLVVLCHGLMGTSQDLEYLGSQLRKEGFVVLQSSTNQLLKSLGGVREGGYSLSEEIRRASCQFNSLEKISIVGNSLGGLYARYAVKELFDRPTGTICGLDPHCFLTIASPHLGIREFTYIAIPESMKKALSLTMLSTGKDLMLNDAPDGAVQDSLLYQMATQPDFLLPLQAFRKRCLYANVDKDFVVPLATAAFLSSESVIAMRKKYANKYGIVLDMVAENEKADKENDDTMTSVATSRMIRGLDSCGWRKVFVHFDIPLPVAHYKISALRRGPEWISNVLGFSEGKYVMDHAVKCIHSCDSK